MKWLDKLSLPMLVVMLGLALAPFSPEPHLLEKSRMLIHGALSKPIDIFDLFLHGTPAVLLLIKLVRFGLGLSKQSDAKRIEDSRD